MHEATRMVKLNYENSILKYSNKTMKQLFENFKIYEQDEWKSLCFSLIFTPFFVRYLTF